MVGMATSVIIVARQINVYKIWQEIGEHGVKNFQVSWVEFFCVH